MIRQLAIELALFLTPFAIYALFVWAARPGDAKAPAWSARVMSLLTVAALILAIGGFAVWAQYSGAPPGSTYVPAHMENGRFVPGTQK
jgi:Family of unknown function (DUF6111)